jgi:alanyl-tRNA synthetase
MGFERLLTVVQGVGSIFETDALSPIVRAVRKAAGGGVGRPDDAIAPAVAVIADHTRAATFAIAENILPSNEGQGYVVRRLLRRALRRGLAIGIDRAFLYGIAGEVVEAMSEAHPHLRQKREQVALVVKSEEERFRETLATGSASFGEIVETLSRRGVRVIPGELAFKLYDTYGFPADLTEEMAAERGFDVDRDGFLREMEKQKERARTAGTFGNASGERREWDWGGGTAREHSVFVGGEVGPTDVEVAEASREPYLSDPIEAVVAAVRPGTEAGWVEFLLSRTPFYAESGGQVADTGLVAREGGDLSVANVYVEDGNVVHIADAPRVPLRCGEAVRAAVDVARRRRIEKNHTATHLLHAALRTILGDHAHQSGSWVGPDRLRFDFTHFAPLSDDELRKVEDQVNAWVRSDMIVSPTELPLAEALRRGAMALFGERYSDRVRVVCVAVADARHVSLELCGGTHVRRTGEIGAFSIVGESGVATGVRRIEALTGEGSAAKSRGDAETLRAASDVLKTTVEELVVRADEVVSENARLRKELLREREKASRESIDEIVERARHVKGTAVVSARTAAADVDGLRGQADHLREKLGSGVGVLGAEIDGSCVLIAVVTDDLVKSGALRAGDVVREVASAMGGRGGGKPHLAQAGGGDPTKLDQALDGAFGIIEQLLKR